jgi:hypothetical protein
MHKNATKCNKTLSKWCKNKHGASKIIDTFETYQRDLRKNHITHGGGSGRGYWDQRRQKRLEKGAPHRRRPVAAFSGGGWR